MITTYKPSRSQQSQFIAQSTKKRPSECVKKLLAANNPAYTEQSLMRLLAQNPGIDYEFACYQWINAMYRQSQSDRFELADAIATVSGFADSIDNYSDRYDFDETPTSGTTLSNWVDVTIAQQSELFDLDVDRTAPAPRRWDIRHWMAIVLAIELIAFGGLWVRDIARVPNNTQENSNL